MSQTPDSGERGQLGEHVNIRFPDGLAAAAGRLAARDGMSTSAWVRKVVDRELAARSGRCPECGK
jgi:hypothetical protein